MKSLNLLADISPDNLPQVGSWLQILFFVVAGALAIVKLISHFQGPKDLKLPQPVMVKEASSYVPRHEFNALKDEVHEIRNGMSSLKDELHRVHTDLLKAGEDRAADIHTRLNAILTGLGLSVPPNLPTRRRQG